MKHVMIDLYGCNPQVLADAFLLHQVLDDYPNRVGMQKVSPVFLKDIQTSCPLDDGLSGFVIIATSHISLHAWPHYGMVNIDIFSCEDFQTTTVGDFAMEMFQTAHIEIHEVERALQSPRGIARTQFLAQTDRELSTFCNEERSSHTIGTPLTFVKPSGIPGKTGTR